MINFSSAYIVDFKTGSAPMIPLHVLLEFLIPNTGLPFLNTLDEDSYFLNKLKKHLAGEEEVEEEEEEDKSNRSISPWSQII